MVSSNFCATPALLAKRIVAEKINANPLTIACQLKAMNICPDVGSLGIGELMRQIFIHWNNDRKMNRGPKDAWINFQ